MIELKSIEEIQQIQSESAASIILYLVDIKEQQTSAGTPYSRLYFRDKKNAISVPLWNVSLDAAKSAYKPDTVYRLFVTVGQYKDNMTIKRIASAEEVTDPQVIRVYKPHLFKSATALNCKLIVAAVGSLRNTVYYPYLVGVYGDKDVLPDTILHAYASINYHDSYPGGFVNHIGGMLTIASKIKENYLPGRCEQVWNVDWQYIMAGILLHDIGKLQTYTPVTEATVRFKDTCLLDHNVIGVGMMYSIHDSLDMASRMPEGVFQQLAYTICYHDNIDKLYTHKRLEDKIISYIDGLEATLAVACDLK